MPIKEKINNVLGTFNSYFNDLVRGLDAQRLPDGEYREKIHKIKHDMRRQANFLEEMADFYGINIGRDIPCVLEDIPVEFKGGYNKSTLETSIQ